MTCRRTDLYWRDALHNAVCQAPGSVQAAARYISEQRGKGITGETLRKKLKGVEGESLSMEMAEILTDYLRQFVATHAIATDWVASLGGQFGLMVDYVPSAPEGGWPCEIEAIRDKLLELHELSGRLAGAGREAIADRSITKGEADLMQDISRQIRTLCYRLERNAVRAASDMPAQA